MAAFRALHASGCFVLPNPWDVGSAIFLHRIGDPVLFVVQLVLQLVEALFLALERLALLDLTVFHRFDLLFDDGLLGVQRFRPLEDRPRPGQHRRVGHDVFLAVDTSPQHPAPIGSQCAA